jgi:energy-coupling factor transporter ATP-binding protein EcfA2
VPYLSALENVELPMTLSGQAGRKKRQRAEELIEAVGLADRIHHRLVEMSGGEQQRVAIAVALANDPKLLLADEPTGEVDSTTALVIYETFKRLNREYGLTTLIVSHDPGIARHVDRVVAIRDGKTATETVRQSVVNGSAGRELSGEGGDGDETEEVFEELVVLDSAGRLQVPKEYLEHFAIQGRARLELVDDGILIRPVSQSVQVPGLEAVDLMPVLGGRTIGHFLDLPGVAGLRRSFAKARARLGRWGRRPRYRIQPGPGPSQIDESDPEASEGR